MLKNVKADIITPVIYSQFGIMVLSPSIAVMVIIINWIVDLVMLSIVLFLIKFNVKKELKKIFLASFVGLIGGLVADFLGMFGSMFDYFVIPIFMFTISFAALYGVYYLISKHVLKVNKKKIKTVAIFMAIFTNPLWLVLINASLFDPDYFVSPKQHFIAEQECRARFISWCTSCYSLDWPMGVEDSPILPIETHTCMREYFDIDFPRTTYCDYTQDVCKEFGVS